ncbi:NAD(P)-dependent dehydrogenase (short-subunit alcohol dehydrogenase family) [Streptomyces sp. KhCrAH-43]|uniref:SDR family NAD(P)-dependent oxidoreductase n=1 Tax=unclassified Streptomyces TaxID=2593676 RepID=UPI00038210FE|nr:MULTISPECIES: SDR family oxidoreductase [unclassified Streptomyces]MYS37246.1 SDR family oxidoreductase [Streptomyces sp. SID4920]MYX64653.1 SDR family oxidoreductase [Streptomyces sp. SID8373]RAJ43005.1 NAD(P)-dependent dehydrogenase (short-subunit alcohol dehydrogenase family) [Streptomyces sp. KhCrAH-43]
MSSPWAGLRLVVTGGGSGIGAAVVTRAAGLGADVLAVGRRADRLAEVTEKTRAEGAGTAVPYAVDITAPDASERIAERAAEVLGGVDALVNNAGHAVFDRLEDAAEADLRKMIDTNLVAPALLIRALLPLLRASRGCVVNVSSVGGVLAMPGRSFYGAGKAALNSLTRSLAVELAPEVRVNAVLPGPVDTGLWDLAAGGDADALRDSIVAGTPLRRFGLAHEVAAWVCHLVDPETSSWVTGSLVSVDGGRTA